MPLAYKFIHWHLIWRKKWDESEKYFIKFIKYRLCPTLTKPDRIKRLLKEWKWREKSGQFQVSLSSELFCSIHFEHFSAVELCSKKRSWVHGVQRYSFKAEQFSLKTREANFNQSAWSGVWVRTAELKQPARAQKARNGECI